MTIKILLADDQCLMLEGIKTVLQHEPEFEVVGTAKDGKSAVTQVRKLQPDIVLIDIEMPKMNGIMATKYICQDQPQTKVIVLTSHNNQEYLNQALQAGAAGYLLKNSLLQDLKQTIHSLGKGSAEVKLQMLAPVCNTISAKSIVRYQEKITYVRKHRKSIYKPARRRQNSLSLSQRTKKYQRTHHGITKASLAPIFDLSEYPNSQIGLSKIQQLSVFNPPIIQHNRQKRYLKRVTWLLIAIFSLVLSIIIF
ncbi:MAG: response regulator transcription factor [Cyanobacteria bacterium J06621_8]